MLFWYVAQVLSGVVVVVLPLLLLLLFIFVHMVT
jgi:hypothetical protein